MSGVNFDIKGGKILIENDVEEEALMFFKKALSKALDDNFNKKELSQRIKTLSLVDKIKLIDKFSDRERVKFAIEMCYCLLDYVNDNSLSKELERKQQLDRNDNIEINETVKKVKDFFKNSSNSSTHDYHASDDDGDFIKMQKLMSRYVKNCMNKSRVFMDLKTMIHDSYEQNNISRLEIGLITTYTSLLGLLNTLINSFADEYKSSLEEVQNHNVSIRESVCNFKKWKKSFGEFFIELIALLEDIQDEIFDESEVTSNNLNLN